VVAVDFFQDCDIDGIGYILGEASLLRRFRTHRLRPTWIPLIRHMKYLTHLSFQCPLPNGSDDDYLGLYSDDIETTREDLLKGYEDLFLKLAKNTSIRWLTINWKPDRYDRDGDDYQQETLDWLVINRDIVHLLVVVSQLISK
jgi:hypothetical protein